MPEKYNLPRNKADVLRSCVKKETEMQRCWPTKWDWMLDEYKVLKDTLASVAEKSIIITKCEITDHRTIQPIPISVNHEYGWLASKPDFKLEIYEPNTLGSRPLPPEYKLVPPKYPR